jgi:hypothetical protein
MGMSYRIDPARRVVLTRGWGVLTTRELIDVTTQILLDPRFDPTFRSLGDLREVTDVSVDMAASAHTAATPLFTAGTRRAIVASSDLAYGVARQFAIFAQRSGQDVRIFREMRQAEEWLEL